MVRGHPRRLRRARRRHHRPGGRRDRRPPARAGPLRPLGQRGERAGPPPRHARGQGGAVAGWLPVGLRRPGPRAGSARAGRGAGRGELPARPGRHGHGVQPGDDVRRRRAGRRLRAARRPRRAARRAAGGRRGRRGRRLDVPDRARRRLRPGAHGALHGARPGRRPGGDHRREVVLLERRRRGHRHAGPARGGARGPHRPRPVPRAPRARRRLAQPLQHPPPQAEAGHQERADRRGRVPRRAGLRAARPPGRR